MREGARVVSVNVGMPAPLPAPVGPPLLSGIVKRPVGGRVAVGPLGAAGDGHGDLEHHGGVRKAIYAYPVEHYDFWRAERPELQFPLGAFGENLTVEGILESDVRPGDHLGIGTTDLVVTQPRFPCSRLAARFQRPTMIREFQASGRSGFYLAVGRPGELGAGDAVRWTAGRSDEPTIAELFTG